jgi:hypothetical protein
LNPHQISFWRDRLFSTVNFQPSNVVEPLPAKEVGERTH